MTVPRPLPPAREEPCCQRICRYNVARVRKVLSLVARLQAHGYDAGEVLDVFARTELAELGRAPESFNPTDTAKWSLYIHDVHRAMQAGARTPEQISQWLCPFNRMGQEEEA